MAKEVRSRKYQGVYYRELEGGDRSYFLRFRLDGKVRRIPIGKRSEGITEAFCNQEKIRITNANRFGEDVARQLQKVKKDEPTFRELVDIYFKTGKVKETTARTMTYLYKVPFIDERKITREMAQNYIDSELSRYKPTTITLRCRQLQAIFRHAIKTKNYKYDDPFANVEMPNSTGMRKRYLSVEEINKLLEAVKDKPRLYLFVKMCLCTGARISTLAAVHSDHIKPNGEVRLYNYKSERWYTGFFDKETMDLIGNRHGYVLAPRGRADRPACHKGIQHPLLKVMDELFNKPDMPHDERAVIHTLRHSVASRMVNKGIPMEVISKTLDHSNPAITARVYAKIAPETIQRSVQNLWD